MKKWYFGIEKHIESGRTTGRYVHYRIGDPPPEEDGQPKKKSDVLYVVVQDTAKGYELKRSDAAAQLESGPLVTCIHYSEHREGAPPPKAGEKERPSMEACRTCVAFSDWHEWRWKHRPIANKKTKTSNKKVEPTVSEIGQIDEARQTQDALEFGSQNTDQDLEEEAENYDSNESSES